MSDKTYVGQKAQALTVGREYEPFSRVTMWYDDEHYFTAGDDTGREMKLECPWATQEIVDKILKRIKGFVYRPFEATGVQMDMAAELGDGVTINGHYFMIGHMTERFDAMGLCDIGARGEKEIDHEYPYLDPRDRELKRRVKLGYKYQGVSIDRLHGLMIVETDGETEGAKVILNSKELAFYNAEGQEQLYFDPAEGCFKFRGSLNVSDNFIVDKFGNVTMKGNLNLAHISSIFWGDTPPNKKRYAASTSGPWHDTMESGDIYCCDWDYTKNEWKEPYKFVGQDGRPGSDGSDANVDFNNILKALQKAASTQTTFITADEVGSPNIYGGKIYGAEMFTNLFSIYPDENDPASDGQGMSLYGGYASNMFNFLKIRYSANVMGGFPGVVFESPASGGAYWDFSKTYFTGSINFAGATDIIWGKNTPTAVLA